MRARPVAADFGAAFGVVSLGAGVCRRPALHPGRSCAAAEPMYLMRGFTHCYVLRAALSRASSEFLTRALVDVRDVAVACMN